MCCGRGKKMQTPRGRPAQCATALIVALFAFCARTQGAPLAPSGAFLTPGEPDPTGGVAIGSILAPFATPPGPGQFSGTLSTTVIRDDPSNPFAGIGDPNPLNHG